LTGTGCALSWGRAQAVGFLMNIPAMALNTTKASMATFLFIRFLILLVLINPFCVSMMIVLGDVYYY
jgi:hypothetical protein